METCALCPKTSDEGVLVFQRIRGDERVDLEIPLCGDCGSRIEKHLKRAIPKRLMRISPVRHIAGLPAPLAARKAA